MRPARPLRSRLRPAAASAGCRGVDRQHLGGAAARGVERPLALVAEQVEHAPARRRAPRRAGGSSAGRGTARSSGRASRSTSSAKALELDLDPLRHLAPPRLALERQALERAQRRVGHAHHAARLQHRARAPRAPGRRAPPSRASGPARRASPRSGRRPARAAGRPRRRPRGPRARRAAPPRAAAARARSA